MLHSSTSATLITRNSNASSLSPEVATLTARQRSARAYAIAERTSAPTRKGGSWQRSPSNAAKKRARSWRSRDAWKAAVQAAMASKDGDEARVGSNGSRGRQALVSVAAVHAVGLFMAEHASGDGSGVALAHATIARALGLSSSTVQRARRVLRSLGLQVEVAPGGYLTSAERAEAQAKHGGRQLRCAATVTLSQPLPTEVADDLPRRGSYPLVTSPSKMVPGDCVAGKAGAKKGRSFQHRHRWSAETLHLADALAEALPWLGRPSRGTLCRAIINAGIDASEWTAGDLVRCMDHVTAVEGRRFAIPRKLDNPVGFFIHRIRTAMTHARMTGWQQPSAVAKAQALTAPVAPAPSKPPAVRQDTEQLRAARAAFHEQIAAESRLHEQQELAQQRLEAARIAEAAAARQAARDELSRLRGKRQS